jgi:hypothetical protein
VERTGDLTVGSSTDAIVFGVAFLVPVISEEEST